MVNVSLDWEGFAHFLAEQVSQAQRKQGITALILVQLSDHALYNFRFGFHHGEMIVENALARLDALIPRAKAIYRFAPDKIGVVVGDVAVPELLALSARKIVDELGTPFLIDNEIVSIIAKVGISIYPVHGDSGEALLSEAELAIGSSFKHGKAFHIPSRARSHQKSQLLQMGQDLQKAIAEEHLSLDYQPKFDLKTLKPKSVEALMRWTLPDGVRVSPEEFIPVAEASGTIFDLTEWAINTALREGSELNWEGLNSSVAINLSASTIYDASLVTILESALAIWDLPSHQLILEVTESSLMKNPELCFRNLSRIRDQGVKISIDDFGTGFSSLSYFKNIPADEIKIDQSFVKNMSRDGSDEKIVKLIIDLAHTFNLEVVAEGIEDEVTLGLLQQMGCDVGQGFYLSRPMNFEEYQHWLVNVSS